MSRRQKYRNGELQGQPSATHLLCTKHETHADRDQYTDQTGVCCFCGHDGLGQHVDEATSEKYFSDDDLLDQPTSEHVCMACAWCMDRRTYK